MDFAGGDSECHVGVVEVEVAGLAKFESELCAAGPPTPSSGRKGPSKSFKGNSLYSILENVLNESGAEGVD